ncbi:MAG: tRNA lysidine(34) synthetase TilS [Acetobacteraceae bacterium]|nr:tRNA lysidine(34) synthetase TilS [Acetobacteraceae bacterium]
MAVSGGADSSALALLARSWAARRRGTLLALIVDHRLRTGSDAEAALTGDRLAAIGIRSRVLPIEGLRRGPALAARARDARYAALTRVCAGEGILHLLLGHHAGDQAETVLLRRAGGSLSAGLAAMPAVRETDDVRLLRPLLDVPPGRLRATLHQAGLDWIEDPSNADPAATRARIRASRDDPDGTGEGTAALGAEAAARGGARASAEREAAAVLAACASFRPQGFVVVRAPSLPPDALAAALAAVTGGRFRLSPRDLRRFAPGLGAGTVGGAEIRSGGRWAPDAWLLLREAAAMAPPVPAEDGAEWDGRYRLRGSLCGGTLGALGPDARRLRDCTALPAAVLATLPAIRRGATLLAVPGVTSSPDGLEVTWCPTRPAACAPFLPLATRCSLRG